MYIHNVPRSEYVLYTPARGVLRGTAKGREKELFLEFCAIKFMQSPTTNKMAASYGHGNSRGSVRARDTRVFFADDDATLNYKYDKTFN